MHNTFHFSSFLIEDSLIFFKENIVLAPGEKTNKELLTGLWEINANLDQLLLNVPCLMQEINKHTH